MTPRAAHAWSYHFAVLRRRELADTMNVMAMGARGEPRELKKMAKELNSEVL